MEGSRELKQYPELEFLLDLRENFLVRELRKPWRALRALNAAGNSTTDYWCIGEALREEALRQM